MEILEIIIQQGLDSGELTAANARVAAVAIGAILEGTVVLWIYDPEQIDIKKHIKSNLKLLINGLASPEGIPARSI